MQAIFDLLLIQLVQCKLPNASNLKKRNLRKRFRNTASDVTGTRIPLPTLYKNKAPRGEAQMESSLIRAGHDTYSLVNSASSERPALLQASNR